jgi:hypothetical protein
MRRSPCGNPSASSGGVHCLSLHYNGFFERFGKGAVFSRANRTQSLPWL